MLNKKFCSDNFIQTLFALCFICYFISAYYDFKIINIEYFSLICFLAVLVCYICLSRKKRHSIDWIKNILMSVIPMTLISFLKFLSSDTSIINVYKFYFYILLPPIVVWLLVNVSSNKSIHGFFNIVFVIAIVFFVVKFFPKLNWSTIKTIDFLNSYSPFETANEFLTFTFFICEVYFGDNNKKKRCVTSWFFCFLSFKRYLVAVSTIYMVWKIFFDWIRIRGKHGYINKKQPKSPNRLLYYIIIVGFMALPSVLVFLINHGSQNKLWKIFEEISSGRVKLLEIVLNSNINNFGFGTCSYIIQQEGGEYYKAAIAVHNELFRLFFETTIVGYLLFVFFQFRSSKNNRQLFIFNVVFFMHMMLSNCLSDFYPMLMLYLLNYYFYNKDNKSEKSGKVEEVTTYYLRK